MKRAASEESLLYQASTQSLATPQSVIRTVGCPPAPKKSSLRESLDSSTSLLELRGGWLIGGDRRGRSREEKDTGRLCHVYTEEMPSTSTQDTTVKTPGCWQDSGMGLHYDHQGFADVIFEALQSGSRGFVVNNIICEWRNPDNPPTLERLQERVRYERYSPSKHSFVLFSRHRCSG